MKELKELVDRQAEDELLWNINLYPGQTKQELALQQALRRLHYHIEQIVQNDESIKET